MSFKTSRKFLAFAAFGLVTFGWAKTPDAHRTDLVTTDPGTQPDELKGVYMRLFRSNPQPFFAGTGVVGIPVSASDLAGTWSGGKTENNPYQGGYLNLDFRFQFGSDGSYAEVAMSGSTALMQVTGTYSVGPGSKPGDPFFKSLIAFSPKDCRFAGDDAKRMVAPFPIPMDREAQYYIAASPLSGGGQLTLQSADGPSDSWGLKPAR